MQYTNPSWLTKQAFDSNTSIAITWIKRSFEVTGNKGSSAYYRKLPWRKGHWAAAYPETTGYLIGTLLDYYEVTGNSTLKKLAIDAANWLVSLQHPNGAMPGGFVDGALKPSIFNTGMILFGLKRMYQKSNDPVLLSSIKKAVQWLLEIQEQDGSWRKAAYSKGFIPSYYTKVVWAILEVNKILKMPSVNEKMTDALGYYRSRITDDYFISDCGFHRGELALTHTLAYSLTGFIQSARILQKEQLYKQVLAVCKKLATLVLEKEEIAGKYHNHWKGDYRFQCLTGNAQLAIIFANLFDWEKEDLFKETALTIFDSVIKSQRKKGDIDVIGAIPGSRPGWGEYFRFSYPNWGVKFFLDAYLTLLNLTIEPPTDGNN